MAREKGSGFGVFEQRWLSVRSGVPTLSNKALTRWLEASVAQEKWDRALGIVLL